MLFEVQALEREAGRDMGSRHRGGDDGGREKVKAVDPPADQHSHVLSLLYLDFVRHFTMSPV
jgi:hypothetical protein